MSEHEQAKPETFSYQQGTNPTDAKLTLAGQPVENLVSRVSVDHVAGGLPTVFLELRPGIGPGQLGGIGHIVVRETIEEDPADAMLRFLEPIDPGELEKACLAAMELGGPETFGEAALSVLRGWARGD